MDLLDDIERKVQRRKYLLMVNILEGHRSNINQALSRMGNSKQLYQSAHSRYAYNWKGQTREAYDEIGAELHSTGNKVNVQGEQLIREINKEIRRLLAKAKGLR
ncbi:hypothetical protein [Ferdinandcohnia sp. Marseille-Q9671]